MPGLLISLVADTTGMEGLDVEAEFYAVLIIVVIVVTAILLMRAIRELIPVKVRPTNLCEGCNYDLYANESGVCPECGRMTPPRPNTSDWPAIVD